MNCLIFPTCKVDYWQGARIFVFALVSGLHLLSVLAAISMTLSLCIWYVLNESLCITYETNASGGRSGGAKLTVLLPFAPSFSKGVGVVDSFATYVLGGGGVGEANGACWRRSQNVVSPVLSRLSVLTVCGKDYKGTNGGLLR